MSRERAEYGERRLSPQDIEIAGLNRISALKGCVMRMIGGADTPPPANREGAVHRLGGWGIRQNKKRLARLRRSHVSYDSVSYMRGISV
jgi:hypothetical protein